MPCPLQLDIGIAVLCAASYLSNRLVNGAIINFQITMQATKYRIVYSNPLSPEMKQQLKSCGKQQKKNFSQLKSTAEALLLLLYHRSQHSSQQLSIPYSQRRLLLSHPLQPFPRPPVVLPAPSRYLWLINQS